MANPTGWKPDMQAGTAPRAEEELGVGHATRGLAFEEGLLFERGSRGRTGVSLPPRGSDADPASEIPAALLRAGVEGLPEVGELEVVRHFTRLSPGSTRSAPAP